MDADAFDLSLPLLLMVLIPIIAVHIFRDPTSGKRPLFELGVVYMAVVAVYSIIPFLIYLYHGMRITTDADFRLMAMDPTHEEFISMAWNEAIYLFCFTLGYGLVRAGKQVRLGSFARPEWRTAIVLIVVLLVLELFFLYLRAVYATDSPRNYADANKVARAYPLLLRQFANHLGGIEWTLKLVIMLWLMMDFKRTWYVIAGWLTLETVLMLTALGARQPYFIFIALSAAAYHFAVKPIPGKWIVIGGTATLVLFIVIGYERLGKEVGAGANAPTSMLESSNEFEALLTNALDVRRLRALGHGNDVQGSLYFSDIYKLIPQQMLPFEKTSPLEWYANTFYDFYVEWGGGFAFGAISEAMLGTGIPDLVWRGAVLGAVFGGIHRALVCRGKNTFRSVALYIWFMVMCFSSFRDSTFAFISAYIYRFLPVIVLMMAISRSPPPDRPRPIVRPVGLV